MNQNFKKLTTNGQNRIIDYAEIIYTDLNAQKENWKLKRNNRHTVRAITHGNYDRIHTLSVPSGLISKSALESKRNDSEFVFTKDHCYRPQLMLQMFMDRQDIFLSSFEVFLEYVIIASTTILITSDENEKLKSFTKNKNGHLIVEVPTDKIYQESNIELFETNYGRGWWKKDLKPASNYLITPEPYLDYEKTFLVN
jgi:hypothetical protein